MAEGRTEELLNKPFEGQQDKQVLNIASVPFSWKLVETQIWRGKFYDTILAFSVCFRGMYTILARRACELFLIYLNNLDFYVEFIRDDAFLRKGF